MVSGPKVLVRPLDDARIRIALDDNEPFAERKQQVDDPGADAAGTANYNVLASSHWPQSLQPDRI